MNTQIRRLLDLALMSAHVAQMIDPDLAWIAAAVDIIRIGWCFCTDEG